VAQYYYVYSQHHQFWHMALQAGVTREAKKEHVLHSLLTLKLQRTTRLKQLNLYNPSTDIGLALRRRYLLHIYYC